MKSTWVIGAVLVGFAVAAGAGILTGHSPSAVDWKSLRVIAFESDDWGLQGFVPDVNAWQGLDRAELAPGRFPEVYWESTLEDSLQVAALCALMQEQVGRDGLPAVFQPNYVMSGLEWVGNREGGTWRRHDLPDLAAHYARPGLWSAVRQGIVAGVWHPEYHATWHYDPRLRKEAALSTEVAAAATARDIMLFPGSEAARELGSWRPRSELAVELDSSLHIFEDLFGRRPDAVIAPDYTWQQRHEQMWESRGLTIIQGKREQRNPEWGSGQWGRVAKLWWRHWERWRYPQRAYLERNCRLEPVQDVDPMETAARCAEETLAAWGHGEPAVVETHRINFAHARPEVAATGRNALSAYFARLETAGPWYVCDVEIAQLQRGGTSWRRSGDDLVLRNGSRSRRIVAVPVTRGHRRSDSPGLGSELSSPLLIALPARSSVRIPIESSVFPGE